jgi:WD40 repeat protein
MSKPQVYNRNTRPLRRAARSLSYGAVTWLLLAGFSPHGLVAQFGGPQAYVHAEFEVDNPTALAFSPNDRFIAVGDKNGQIFVFDVQSTRRAQEMRPVRSRIVGLEFSSDGSVLFAAAEDKRIVELDLFSGSVTREQRTEKKIRSFDVSPDGRFLVWAGDDGMVEVLNRRFMRQDVLVSPNMFRKKLVFTAFGLDGSEVYAAADEEGRSAFWALGEDDPIRSGELVRERYNAFAKDEAGQLLALGVKGISLGRSSASRGAIGASAHHTVRIVDWNRGRVVREIEELPDDVRALAISPDRSTIAIALDNGEMDGYSTQEARRIMGIHEGSKVNTVQFSPSGRWLAAGMDRGGVTVWEMSGAEATESARPNVVQQGDVLAQSGKYEFTTGRDPLITTFDRFTMAVLDLDNLGVEQSLAASVMNLVVSRLANVPYIDLVERGDVEQVLGELKLQNTGITSARDAAEIGRLLNAQNVLLGNVNQLGTSLTIAVRLVETESGRVLGAREILCRNCRPEDLPQGISLLVSSLVQVN